MKAKIYYVNGITDEQRDMVNAGAEVKAYTNKLDLGMGMEWLEEKAAHLIPRTEGQLNRTHTWVRTIEIENIEDAFAQMQGDRWSPNGEARELIETLGLNHTSMSVGDVVVVDGEIYLCDCIGFVKVGRDTEVDSQVPPPPMPGLDYEPTMADVISEQYQADQAEKAQEVDELGFSSPEERMEASRRFFDPAYAAAQDRYEEDREPTVEEAKAEIQRIDAEIQAKEADLEDLREQRQNFAEILREAGIL